MSYAELHDQMRRCRLELKRIADQIEQYTNIHHVPKQLWKQRDFLTQELKEWNERGDNFLHDKLAAANLEPIHLNDVAAPCVMRLVKTQKPGLYRREFSNGNGQLG